MGSYSWDVSNINATVFDGGGVDLPEDYKGTTEFRLSGCGWGLGGWDLEHRSLLAPGPDNAPHYPGLPWLETLPGATSEVETLYFHATGVPVGSSFWDGRGAGSESWEPRTDRTAKQYIKNQNFSNLNSHFTMLPLSSTRFLQSRIGGVLQRKGPQTWGDGCQPAGYSYVLVHLALARLSDSHMTRRGGDGG